MFYWLKTKFKRYFIFGVMNVDQSLKSAICTKWNDKYNFCPRSSSVLLSFTVGRKYSSVSSWTHSAHIEVTASVDKYKWCCDSQQWRPHSLLTPGGQRWNYTCRWHLEWAVSKDVSHEGSFRYNWAGKNGDAVICFFLNHLRSYSLSESAETRFSWKVPYWRRVKEWFSQLNVARNAWSGYNGERWNTISSGRLTGLGLDSTGVIFQWHCLWWLCSISGFGFRQGIKWTDTAYDCWVSSKWVWRLGKVKWHGSDCLKPHPGGRGGGGGRRRGDWPHLPGWQYNNKKQQLLWWKVELNLFPKVWSRRCYQ